MEKERFFVIDEIGDYIGDFFDTFEEAKKVYDELKQDKMRIYSGIYIAKTIYG